MGDEPEYSPEAEASEDPLIGQLFDEKYRITRKIGGGGMGLVYEAHHEWMERRVALKVLRPHFISGNDYATFLERFKREAQTASRITHPSAVTIYDFGIFEEMPYLAMQFIQGKTVSEIIKEEGPFDEKRAMRLLLQVCEAVAAAHSLQIVHRDIKPDNIMVTRSPEGRELAQVLDFGIAKVVDTQDQSQSNMTLPGKAVGTPRYMSPEQVLAQPIDARTDVYALGLTLYEMISGDIPFRADSAMQLMFHHVNTPPSPIRDIHALAALSNEVEQVIMKALEKDPNKRFQTVLDFADTLRGVSAYPPQNTLDEVPTLTAHTTTRKSVLALVGATTSLAALGAIAVWFMLAGDTQQDAATTEAALPSEAPSVNPSPINPNSVKQDQLVQHANNTQSTSSPSIESGESSAAIKQKSSPTQSQNNETSTSSPAGTDTTKPLVSELPVRTADSLEDSTLPADADQPIASTPEIRTESGASQGVSSEEEKTTESVNAVEPTSATDTSSSEAISSSPTIEQNPDEPAVASAKESAAAPTEEFESAASAGSTAENNTVTTQERAAEVTTQPQVPIAKQSVDALIALLAAEDRNAREQAAIELQQRGKAPVPALIKALQQSKSPRVRYWAVFILGKLRASEALSAVEAALGDEVSLVSETAKKALIAINPQRASELLGTPPPPSTTQPEQQEDKSLFGIF